METPQLDLASELLGVYKDEMLGNEEDGSELSGDDVSSEHEQFDTSESIARTNSYIGAPRRVKVGLGQHRRKITKRTRFPMKWNHVRTFKNSTEAEEFVQTFEGFSWRKGCNNKTSYGIKAYYICKESPLCKVMSLLHYDSKEKQVILYRSDRQHSHGQSNTGSTFPRQNSSSLINNSQTTVIGDISIKTEPYSGRNSNTGGGATVTNGQNADPPHILKKRIGGGRRRGLSDETIGIINQLYAMDPQIKPSQVQEELRRHGIPLLQNYHINNFLVKLRKQSRSEGTHQGPLKPRRGRPSRQSQLPYSTQQYSTFGGNNGDFDSYYSDDDHNSTSIGDTWFTNPNPMSMVDIKLKNPFNDEKSNDNDFHGENELLAGNHPFANNGSLADETLIHDDSMSVTISREPISANAIRNSTAFPATSTSLNRRNSSNSTGSPAALPSTSSPTSSGFKNQSEIVSTSNTSRTRKRNFYFRDETTKDGDEVLPSEDNIKGVIIQHIIDNYSNRDMLHIREELQTLKDMKKFSALNRLISFTSGFLQDSFIDVTGNTNEDSPK